MPTYYKLTQCYPYENVIYTDTDLSGYSSTPIIEINGVVGTCYTYEVTLTPISPVPITVTGTFNSCAQCTGITYYKLTQCGTGPGLIIIYTNSDLSAYLSFPLVQIDIGMDFCYSIEEVINPPGYVPVTVIATYLNGDCAVCGLPTPVYYELTECRPGTSIVYTYTDLSIYPATDILSISGTCYSFLETATYSTPPVLVTVDASFSDCETCKYPCYTLTNCDSTISFNVITDLSAYIGDTISITTPIEYAGECFTVVGNLSLFLCTDTIEVTGMSLCDCTPGCGCPEGYELLEDGVTCEQVLTAPATATPTIYPIGEGAQEPSYGFLGANLYQDITTLTFPIKQVWSAFYDNNGTGPALTAVNLLPSPNAFTVWQNRLRTINIWKQGFPFGPVNSWLGVTYCFTVPVARTYCIAFAADDVARLYINGVLAVKLDYNPPTGPLTWNHDLWHIIPITLNAGVNVISCEGLNYLGSGGYGFEIYEATAAEISLVTTEAQLTPYIKYSTESLLPPNPQAYFSWGSSGSLTPSGYTCPEGYTLSTCDGIVCVQITQTPVLPCCYELKVCGTETIYITSTDVSTRIGTTVTLDELPGCFEVLGVSETCEGAISVTIRDSFAGCPECSGASPLCYTLTADCPEGSGLSFKVFNDLSASVGSVIKVCPSDLPVPNPTPPNPGIPLVPTEPGEGLQLNLINACDPSEILIITNILYSHIGKTISVPSLDNKCWIVSEFLLVGTSMGFIDLTGAYLYDNWGPCVGIFPCDVPYLPELLECACFTISDSAFCDGAITLTNLGEISATCLECAPPPPVCYELSDCQGVVDSFIVCDDLSGYIGSVIKIEGCGDTCWSVALADTCDNSICLNGAITTFTNCFACLPPPPVPTPFALHARRIKPGYFSTNSCLTTDYIERVNCTFALEVYNQMIINRYGVTVCCDNDLDQWAIKKQVLDFELLTDPDLCKSTLNPFVPSCPDEPI